jgi:hypothetical protein
MLTVCSWHCIHTSHSHIGNTDTRRLTFFNFMTNYLYVICTELNYNCEDLRFVKPRTVSKDSTSIKMDVR